MKLQDCTTIQELLSAIVAEQSADPLGAASIHHTHREWWILCLSQVAYDKFEFEKGDTFREKLFSYIDRKALHLLFTHATTIDTPGPYSALQWYKLERLEHLRWLKLNMGYRFSYVREMQ